MKSDDDTDDDTEIDRLLSRTAKAHHACGFEEAAGMANKWASELFLAEKDRFAEQVRAFAKQLLAEAQRLREEQKQYE